MSLTTSEQWERIQAIFAEIVELTPELRSKKLEELTNGDHELRSEVQSLLRFDSEKQLVCTSHPPLSSNFQGAKIGNYQLAFPLAINQKTEVWKAEDLSRPENVRDRFVAIKFLKDKPHNSTREQRFEQEARFLFRFSHPGIARFLDFGRTNDEVPYLVTRYVEGRDIVSKADQSKLNLEQRVELVVKVCEAIEYSHRFMIVHRDLKPANILVDGLEQPVVIDFGISKQVDSVLDGQIDLTQTNERPMTPAYASPEQLRGEPVSTVTDVYAIGLVLYQLICGHHPYSDDAHRPDTPLFDRVVTEMPCKPSQFFSGSMNELIENAEAKSLRIDARMPERPEQLKSKLKRGLDQIVLKAIAKSPDDRYSSVGSFRNDLTDYLQGRRPSGSEPENEISSWVRSHPRASIVAAALLGFGIAFALQSVFPRDAASTSSKTNPQNNSTIAALNSRVALLEVLANRKLDVDQVTDSQWQNSSLSNQRLLAQRAIEQKNYGLAKRIADSQRSIESVRTPKDEFELANLYLSLGMPTNGLNVASLAPEEFSEIASESLGLEEFRSLYCQLLIDCGRFSKARLLNDERPTPSSTDKIEKKLFEAKIRLGHAWDAGAKEIVDSLEEIPALAETNPARRQFLNDEIRRLKLKFRGDPEEIAKAVELTRDEDGAWSKSQLQFEELVALVGRQQFDLANQKLSELREHFESIGLPNHHVAVKAADLSRDRQLKSVDFEAVWNQLQSEGEFGSVESFFVFSEKLSLSKDSVEGFEAFQKVEPAFTPIELDNCRIRVLEEVWKGACAAKEFATASSQSKLLVEAFGRIYQPTDIEVAYGFAVAAISDNAANPAAANQSFQKSVKIIKEIVESEKSNLSTVFLEAIDLESQDQFCRFEKGENFKTSADWIHEFRMHRYNTADVQLEMAAFFSENHTSENSPEILRMIDVINAKHSELRPNNQARFTRLNSVAERLAKKGTN